MVISMSSLIHSEPFRIALDIDLPPDAVYVGRSVPALILHVTVVMIALILTFYWIFIPPKFLHLPLFPTAFWVGIVGATIGYAPFLVTNPVEGVRFKHAGFLIRSESGRRFVEYCSLKSAAACDIREKQILVQLSMNNTPALLYIVFPARMKEYYYAFKRALTGKGIVIDENFRTERSGVGGLA